MNTLQLYLFLSFFTSFTTFAQSDIINVLKGGELLINGLSFLKSNKSEVKSTNSKFIESICVKNKLADKITFKITGKDEDDDEISKEMIIQKDGKECVFELLKGVYSYEILLSNKEIYKKGEYKFIEETTITVKEE